MQLKISKVGRPHQRRQILRHAIVHPLVIAPAPHARCLHPIGTMLRAILLVEKGTAHAVGIALHGQRPPAQVRQQHGRNAHVIVDHLPLIESRLGIQNLVQVRQLQVPALDIDHGLFGHHLLACLRNDAMRAAKYARAMRHG